MATINSLAVRETMGMDGGSANQRAYSLPQTGGEHSTPNICYQMRIWAQRSQILFFKRSQN